MHDLTLIINNISLSILLINLIPVLVIYFLISTTILRRYPIVSAVYLSFASGGLMADVFLRLVPHIITSSHNSVHTHNQSHDNRMGLVILLSIFVSFFIEKFFRSSHDNQEEEETRTSLIGLFLLADILYKYTTNRILISIFLPPSTPNVYVIMMKIVSQLLHLFFGYAVFIYSRMSSTKAMRFQLLTGFLGSVLSFIPLQLPSDSLPISWLDQLCLPIITGIFTYISTVHIIPEVFEQNSGTKGAIFKISTFAVSVLIIFSLNKYD